MYFLIINILQNGRMKCDVLSCTGVAICDYGTREVDSCPPLPSFYSPVQSTDQAMLAYKIQTRLLTNHTDQSRVPVQQAYGPDQQPTPYFYTIQANTLHFHKLMASLNSCQGYSMTECNSFHGYYSFSTQVICWCHSYLLSSMYIPICITKLCMQSTKSLLCVFLFT